MRLYRWVELECLALFVPARMRVKLLLNGPCNSRKFRTAVVKFVAAKAPRNLKDPQVLVDGLQIIPSKALKKGEFQQTSTVAVPWFGTRGSEVQILSPRPIKSMTYRMTDPTLWCWARCSTAERRVNIGFLAEAWKQAHLQSHLQSEEMVQSNLQATKPKTLLIRLI